MKTGTLTFVRAYNHGAVLQAYALNKKLNELGIDNEVVDYYPKYFRELYTLSYLGKMRLFPYRPLKNWIKYTPLYFTLQRRIKGFERFISKNIVMSSKQYKDVEELNQDTLDYDAFISGSDQVWSNRLAKFDPAFFLDFNSANNSKKWSYAASFGFQEVPVELRDEYVRRLSGWDKHSVREEKAVELLKDLTGKVAEKNCDPTLLLNRESWDKVRSEKKRKKPYVLVYYVNTTNIFKQAKELAVAKDLEVVSCTSAYNSEGIEGPESKKYGIKHLGSCSPDDFLSLFANSEYVITDSFHGTVFSLIYHKQFLVRLDLGNGYYNNRAKDLINMVGEAGRDLQDDVYIIDDIIDWKMVDTILDEYRQESITYLQGLLDQSV